MKSFSAMGPSFGRCRYFGTIVLLALAATASNATAQGAPPIGGVTGTVAMEGTVDREYGAANTLIVKTKDGVEHVFHYTKDLVFHGGKDTSADALKDLRAGTTVVVHYSMAGGEASAVEVDRIDNGGLKITEGVVTRIDRRQKQITVRFGDGTTETFALTERAAADAGKDVDDAVNGTTKVTVYFTDEAGNRVAHFFKKVS